MMKKGTAIALWITLFAMLLCFSCTPHERLGGAVTIILSSGGPETRANLASPEDGMIYINNGTPDLILLLFNSQGTLVAKYPDSGHSSVMNSPAPTGNDMMIRLSQTVSGGIIPEGTYSLYGIANTAGVWALTDGENSISAGALDASSITTKTQADALCFSPLFEANSVSKPHPELRAAPNNRLPLTAKTSVTVSANGNGSAELQMQRCVAQVIVRFVNNYGAELSLSAYDASTPFFTLHNMNPNTGYLFQHSPDVPAGTVYADFVNATVPSVLYDNTDNDGIDPDYSSDAYIYRNSALVFPGTGTYTCDVAFKVTAVNGSALASPAEFRFTDLPVHNYRGEDITSISRNQRLTVTITISQGQMLSFSFDVGDWTELTETVHFD